MVSFTAIWLREAKQHRKEGEKANADEEEGDRHDRRLLSLFGNACDWRERLTPQVTKAPPVLPNGNDECQDAARDQRESQVFRCRWKIVGTGSGRLLQMFEVLDDRKAKANQRDRSPQPRHYRAFEGQPGADPGEMIARGRSNLEPGHAQGGM